MADAASWRDRISVWLLTVGTVVWGTGAVGVMEGFTLIGCVLTAVGATLIFLDLYAIAVLLPPEARKRLRVPAAISVLVLTMTSGFGLGYWRYKLPHTPEEYQQQGETRAREALKPVVEGLREQTAELKEEARRARATNATLEMFGGDLHFYRKWNPYQHQNETLELGNCGGIKCPTLTLLGIEGQGPDATINLKITSGYWPTLYTGLPLQKGCFRELLIAGSGLALHAIVEDDSHHAPLLGVVFGRKRAAEPAEIDRTRPRRTDYTKDPKFGAATAPPQFTCGAAVYKCDKSSDVDLSDPRACLRF